jgi:hypothetical protein
MMLSIAAGDRGTLCGEESFMGIEWTYDEAAEAGRLVAIGTAQCLAMFTRPLLSVARDIVPNPAICFTPSLDEQLLDCMLRVTEVEGLRLRFSVEVRVGDDYAFIDNPGPLTLALRQRFSGTVELRRNGGRSLFYSVSANAVPL